MRNFLQISGGLFADQLQHFRKEVVLQRDFLGDDFDKGRSEHVADSLG